MNDLLRDKALEALEAAKCGLQWYRGLMPEYVDGRDHEADRQIDDAITSLRAAAPVVQQGVSDEQIMSEALKFDVAVPDDYLMADIINPRAVAFARSILSLAGAAAGGVPQDLISAADAHADMYEGSDIPARDVRAAITNAFYAGSLYAAPAGVPLSASPAAPAPTGKTPPVPGSRLVTELQAAFETLASNNGLRDFEASPDQWDGYRNPHTESAWRYFWHGARAVLAGVGAPAPQAAVEGQQAARELLEMIEGHQYGLRGFGDGSLSRGRNLTDNEERIIRKALNLLASPAVASRPLWKPMSTAPMSGEFLATIVVNHAGLGEVRHKHVLLLDDESGGIHRDYEQGWDLDDYEAWTDLPPFGAAPSAQEPRAASKTFEQAWKRFEQAGYKYGSDALEQVRFGWDIAHGKAPRG